MNGLTIFVFVMLSFAIYWFLSPPYYIEFDGTTYWVWHRHFMGYDRCKGMFSEETEAQICVEKLKKNPPRMIDVRRS